MMLVDQRRRPRIDALVVEDPCKTEQNLIPMHTMCDPCPYQPIQFYISFIVPT